MKAGRKQNQKSKEVEELLKLIPQKIVLSEKSFNKILDLINNPPNPTMELIKLMKEKK